LMSLRDCSSVVCSSDLEHVPEHKRGFYTSFIQITATFGLFVSLLVILAMQSLVSKQDFAAWGWRIPFLLSIIMLGISLYIRLKIDRNIIVEHRKAGVEL